MSIPTPNYENMKVIELRKELKEKGLPIGGLKTTLIERLSAANEVSDKFSGESLTFATSKPKTSKPTKNVTSKTSKSTKDITPKTSKPTKDVTPKTSKSTKDVLPKSKPSKPTKNVTSKSKTSKSTKPAKNNGNPDTKNNTIFKIKSLDNQKLIMIDYTNPDKIVIKSGTKILETLIPSEILTMAIGDFDNEFVNNLDDPNYNDQTPVEERVPLAYIYDLVPTIAGILEAEEAPMFALLDSILIDLILGKSLAWIPGDELQFSDNNGYFINGERIEVPLVGIEMQGYDPRTIIFY